MKMNLPRLTTTLIACLFSSNLYAQDTGVYAEMGLGASFTSLDTSFWDDNSVTSSSLKTTGLAFNAALGYQINHILSLETGYLRIADIVFSGVSNGVDTLWSSGNVEGRTKIDGMTIQAMALIPVEIADLQLYIKGGLFFWDTIIINDATINDINRFQSDGSSLIGGIGLQMHAWGDWMLRGEAQYTPVTLENGQNVDVSYITFNLVHPIK